MHEFSIVQSLLEVIEEEAKRHKAQKVLRVELLVGVLSGVEPHLLELAFNTFKEGTIAEEALLVVEIEKLR
jgi:hydrogenase nickel incorporation protein HypA/HybF